MRKRILAVVLLIAMLFTLNGCGVLQQLEWALLEEQPQPDKFEEQFSVLGEGIPDLDLDFRSEDGVPAYEDLVYVRPDPAELQNAADAVEEALESEDYDTVLEKLDRFYDLYWEYYGMYTIAIIESDADVNDAAMWEEYVYCTDISLEIDEIINDLLAACAASSYKTQLEKDFFGAGGLDGFVTDITPNAQMLALYEQENALIEDYLQLHGQMSRHPGGEEFYDLFSENAAELYIALIQVRNEQASVCGYASYAEMMFDDACYDYALDDLMAFYKSMQNYFAPVYQQQLQSGAYDYMDLKEIEPEEAFALTCEVLLENDVAGISGMLEELMAGGYYNVGFSRDKRDTTYAIYIDSVDMPYLFLYPYGDIADCLSIAHELGHCDDMKLNYDTTYSTDISETLSQGMEYLLLCQEDLSYRDELLQYKLLERLESNLYTASLAMFELLAYELPEEELTPEGLHRLYAQVSEEFGMYLEPMDSDESWIYVDHVFQFPFYIASYSISDIAAFNFYLMEQEEPYSGEKAYMDLQWDAPDYAFVEVLNRSGVPSPFADGQVAAQARTVAQILHTLSE